jgi:hypothetical protein
MTRPLTTWFAADPCPAATDPGWLTQPTATVAAAVVAVLGAVVAYLGVTKQTRTTQRESRRAERIAVLSDAWTAVVKLSRALERVNAIKDPVVRAGRIAAMAAGPMGDLGDRYAIAASKLRIYRFGVADAATAKLNAALTAMWENLRANPATIADETRSTRLYEEAQRAIKETIEGLG